MKPVKVGDVRVSSIVERDGPWRAPNTMYPTATPAQLAEVMSLVPDFTYDRAKDLLVIAYQTFVVRTPRCTVLIDTCVGEHQRRTPQLLFDAKESAATRWKFYREHANRDTLIIPTHFPGTTAGHIEKFLDTFQFSFLAL